MTEEWVYAWMTQFDHTDRQAVMKALQEARDAGKEDGRLAWEAKYGRELVDLRRKVSHITLIVRDAI